MNEELQKVLAELFNSVINAKDFLVAELPDYISQLLVWHMLHSLLLTMLSTATFVLMLLAPYFIQRSYRNRGFWYIFVGGDSDNLIPIGVVWFFSFSGSFLIFRRWSNLDWLQIMVAPKVWLVEYAASLIK